MQNFKLFMMIFLIIFKNMRENSSTILAGVCNIFQAIVIQQVSAIFQAIVIRQLSAIFFIQPISLYSLIPLFSWPSNSLKIPPNPCELNGYCPYHPRLLITGVITNEFSNLKKLVCEQKKHQPSRNICFRPDVHNIRSLIIKGNAEISKCQASCSHLTTVT